jgi:hypothetical protein
LNIFEPHPTAYTKKTEKEGFKTLGLQASVISRNGSGISNFNETKMEYLGTYML